MADAVDSKSTSPIPEALQFKGFTTLSEIRATTACTTGATTGPTRDNANPREADDLERIAAAWPSLSPAIRAGILAMIDASRGGGQ